MNSWKACFHVTGIIPVLFCVSLLGFYFHAAYILGKFPTYGHPDPKTLGIYVIYSPMILVTGNIWICSLPIWLIVTATYVILKRKLVTWRPVILSLLAQICAIAVFLSTVSEWYAD
jgi:hypothetical protein